MSLLFAMLVDKHMRYIEIIICINYYEDNHYLLSKKTKVVDIYILDYQSNLKVSLIMKRENRSKESNNLLLLI